MSDEKYEGVKDGEAIDIDWRSGEAIRFSCCDCGLVHQINVVAAGPKIRMRFYRMERDTQQRRAERGIILEGYVPPPIGPGELN